MSNGGWVDRRGFLGFVVLGLSGCLHSEDEYKPNGNSSNETDNRSQKKDAWDYIDDDLPNTNEVVTLRVYGIVNPPEDIKAGSIDDISELEQLVRLVKEAHRIDQEKDMTHKKDVYIYDLTSSNSWASEKSKESVIIGYDGLYYYKDIQPVLENLPTNKAHGPNDYTIEYKNKTYFLSPISTYP